MLTGTLAPHVVEERQNKKGLIPDKQPDVAFLMTISPVVFKGFKNSSESRTMKKERKRQ